VVEGCVAQIPYGPGGALHRPYHVGKQLRERVRLLPGHVLFGDVEHQPAVGLERAARSALEARVGVGGSDAVVSMMGGGMMGRILPLVLLLVLLVWLAGLAAVGMLGVWVVKKLR
jgi:hypothetical protein